jgi:hypothetical protein
MPIEGSRGAQLIELQEALKQAEAEKNASKISDLKSKIKALQEKNQAEWDQVLDEASVKRALAKNISNRETLEQIQNKVSNLEAQIQKISALKKDERLGSEALIPPLQEELEKYQIALQISQRKEAEKQKQAAENLLKEKENLFNHLLIGRTRSSFDPNKKYVVYDEARKAGLDHILNMIRSPSYTLERESLEDFKDAVLSLINSKSMRKFMGRDDDMYFSEAEDFENRLKRVKGNLNTRLYPSYGAHIDALENYVSDLRKKGITEKDTRKIKTIIFKSDQTRKLHLAEAAIKQLIEFEDKTAKGEPVTAIAVAAITQLMEQNKQATGTSLLHGEGALHKILNELKRKVEQPISLTPKQFKEAFFKAISEGSTHPFKDELRRLEQHREKLWANSADFPGGFKIHFSSHGKEDSKLINQLMELLVATDAMTPEKRIALEPHIDSMLKNTKLSNELKTILSEVKTRIDTKGFKPAR